MTDDKIIRIKKIGNAAYIIAKICLVFVIIGTVATGAISIAACCVPKDIAKVTLDGSAQIKIDETYLNIGKIILEDVNNGMTQEGQILEISGSEYEYVSADVQDNRLNIKYKALDYTLSVRNFAKYFAAICVSLITDLVLVCFIIALCKAIKNCQSPFEENVIAQMKRLAIAFIPWLLVQGIAESIGNSAFSQNMDINFGIDLGKVLIVLVIVALINVFRYGAVLQQQSDETL